jgi:hypothetical protein
VDAGRGWLIFGLPAAAEVAFHPAEGNTRHESYLICDDLANEIAALHAKGVACAEVVEARWGSIKDQATGLAPGTLGSADCGMSYKRWPDGRSVGS